MWPRLRVFGLIILIYVIASLVLGIASTNIIEAEFSRIETSDAAQDTSRAVSAANNEASTLSAKLSDWSAWDDTYAFITNHNPTYIRSNLTNSTLAGMGVNFINYYDSTGKLVEAKGVNASGNDIATPKELMDAFSVGSPLLATSPTTEYSGFLKTSTSPLILAAQPILTSDSKGPYRGTVVFAKYLATADEQKLADLIHLSVSYTYVGASDQSSDITKVTPHLANETAMVKTLSSSEIAGYQLINDIYGKPLLVTRTTQFRSVHKQSVRALIYYQLICTFVVLAVAIVTIYITRQLIRRDETIQLKNDFFSIASHELRTPLTAIKGNSKLLSSMYGSMSPKDIEESLNDIYISSDRLIRLVTNFLDLARLEQNTIPLDIKAIDLSAIVRPVIADLQTIAHGNQTRLKVELPDDLPSAYADADKVKQIIYNLTGNALKFTEKGAVTISAQKAKDTIIVRVADTGRGIPPELQPTLFQRYTQAKASDAKKGSGLGLYISRLLIEKMGGTVYIESSSPEHGTVLAFTLPTSS